MKGFVIFYGISCHWTCADWCSSRRITTAEYDKHLQGFVQQEQELQEELDEASKADTKFLKTSLSVLELAQNASVIFKEAQPERKQQILNFVTSNLWWNGEKLLYKLEEPFEVLLDASKTENWLPRLDSNQWPFG